MKKQKRSRIGAVILLAAMLIMTGVTVYWDQPDQTYYIALAVGFSLLCALLYLLKDPTGIGGIIYQIFVMAAAPLAGVLLLQNYYINPFGLAGISGYFEDAVGNKGIYPAMLAVNCFFVYLFFWMLSFLLGSFKAGYTIGTILLMIIGIADFFVLQFRGSPIVPWDFLSVRTAASVAGNYTYELDWRFLVSTFGFLLVICLTAKLTCRVKKWPVRLLAGAFMLAGLIIGGVNLQKKEVKDWLGMDQTLFTPNVRYRNNGFLAAFIGNLHLINVEKPEGYSVEKVEEIAEETAADTDSSRADTASFELSSAPNIIVIMNEAFSDLAVLGQFEVTEDYMPNFRKLMETYNGGYLMTSVKGGNTANTEYEFLSGDTMAFLPEGSVVFQQFIHDEVPALPSQLASLGYSTIGIHPYLATGWNRSTVYPLLGFQTFLSQADFHNADTLRDFISDQAAFEKIIEVFENKETDEKQFIFEVTMQNHSGYSKDYPDLTEEVQLSEVARETVQTRAAEKYLTLIKKSDEALGSLIDYFETVEEPTIIVMFGDHEPTDYITDVIAQLTGYDADASLEEQQKQYLVPYMIWNNFDMEMEEVELTSPNFLAADILEAAGIPLTTYQNFLLQLQQILPVVSGKAYVDADGNYYAYDDADASSDAYEELLNRYNILTYNHLTDTGGRVSELFTLNTG